jgi:hypothetical protein
MEMQANTHALITSLHLSDNERKVIRRYRSWARFERGPRKEASSLLGALPLHPDCVLVAGCQRSGTTMLARLISGTHGFQRYALTRDDELDAALVLARYVVLPAGQRYCFQTTYVNDRYSEYRNLAPEQKLIWVLRNPYSVVYSMVYHWRHSALKRLYLSCLRDDPQLSNIRKHKGFWRFGLAEVEKACIAYRAKTEQILKIRDSVDRRQLFVLDYDEFIIQKDKLAPEVFSFINEPYDPAYTDFIRPDSLKKADRLSGAERRLIKRLALPGYDSCKSFVDSSVG